MPPHNSKDAKCTQRTKYMSAPQAVVVQLATLGKLHTCVPYIVIHTFHQLSLHFLCWLQPWKYGTAQADCKSCKSCKLASWVYDLRCWQARCTNMHLWSPWPAKRVASPLPFTKSQSFSQILSELLQLCYPTQAERSRHRPSQIDSYSLQSWQTNPQTHTPKALKTLQKDWKDM